MRLFGSVDTAAILAKLPDGNLLTAERPLQPVQWAAILGSVAVLVWSVPGLIANPDFHIGNEATSVRVLGVDMNGWHALSGFLVAIPGFYAGLRRSWSGLFDLAAAGALLSTAVWASLSTRVAGGLFYFPHGGSDALLHVGTSAIFLAGAAHHYLLAGRRSQQAERPSPIA
jgi:hypothetical protein